MTAEIRLQIKARNNRLIKLREDLGWSVQQAAEKIGISPGVLYTLESFKEGPLRQRYRWETDEMGDTMRWRDVAIKIADFHGVSLDYIWPEAVRYLKARAATVVISANQAMVWDRWKDGKPGEIEANRDVVMHALGCLDEREKRVVESRFGLNGGDEKTLEAVGEDEQITRSRVSQIEAKALHKIRKRLKPIDAGY